MLAFQISERLSPLSEERVSIPTERLRCIKPANREHDFCITMGRMPSRRDHIHMEASRVDLQNRDSRHEMDQWAEKQVV